MFGTLNGVTLPAPSSFAEGREVIGGYNVTLDGSKRRYIKAVKKNWTLTYDMLSVDTYNSLALVYDTLTVTNIQLSQPYITFALTDPKFNVGSENVHMEMSDRVFLAGTDLLSSVTITLMQL